ncbi:MAG: Hsp70 family protein [Deltaproteobacteria bacterium]|jgi:hypothetical protein|nr:Hsp70 family protein [Deltaproteobacteria bacterium]
MSYKNIIGIDFGTTNTYITICPYGTKNKIPLHLTGKTPAIDTAILYSDKPGADQNIFPIIGENATSTYGQASYDEIIKDKYQYYANFKLDIVTNANARRCTVDFFKALQRDAWLNGTPLQPENARVLLGAPSQADDRYRTVLKEAAEAAGLGKVEILDEPLGALLTDLGSGRFPLADALDGYLTVDFGGGTCDFALLRRGEVVKSWGEFELGGRLFDDLFHQWLLAQNPGLDEELRRTRRDFYVWSYCCRRLKEDFSETMTKNPQVVMKAEVGRFGQVSNLTRDEFLARAAAYSPSPSFLDYYNKLSIKISDRLLAGNINLLQWFSDSLKEGLTNIRSINAVSLSGGSSRWFFVKQICSDILNIDNTKILSAYNPFGAISEGLSILPAIKYDFHMIKNKLFQSKDDFLNNEIVQHVQTSIDKCNQNLIKGILIELFDSKLLTLLSSYSSKSISIQEIEADISKIIDVYTKNLPDLILKTFGDEMHALQLIAQDKIQAWLQRFGLRLAEQPARQPAARAALVLDGPLIGDGLAKPLALVLGGAASALASLLLASICGGTGLALVASGPHGLLIGGLGGLAVSGLGLFMGQNRLKDWTKKQKLPIFIIKLFSSKIIRSYIRNEFENNLKKQIDTIGQDFINKLIEDFNGLIMAEINNLAMINAF